MKKKKIFWELIGYLIIVGLIIGQITIGYWYLFAQFIYLFCNLISVIKDICQKVPKSYLVKDICFTALTLGLIIIWNIY